MGLKPIERVLCPLDLSVFSQEILEEAINLTQNYGAHLTILHVVNERTYQELERVAGRVDIMDHVAQDAFNRLEDDRAEDLKMLLKAARAERVPHSSRITVGVPVERIQEIAEEEDIDLIIMGAKGRSSMARSLRFGTVAEKLFRRAKRRVLFVR
jgi:nucleotide-binding universal stress UspA family protein